MRILVTGSRDWEDYSTIRDAIIAEVQEAGAMFENSFVVHGDARGADTLAAKAARWLHMTAEAHPADWRLYGVYNPHAGTGRNTRMVNLGADVCLAFIKNGSRGATDCADKAEAAGIRTLRFEA